MSRFAFLVNRPPSPIADDELASVRRMSGATIIPIEMASDLPNLDSYDGVFISGSPFNFLSASKSPLQERIEDNIAVISDFLVANDIPTLGICFGMQWLGRVRGARTTARYPENISAPHVALTDAGRADQLFGQLPPTFRVYTGHSEALELSVPGTTFADAATILATGKNCPVQALRFGSNVYGVQFHPEIDEASLELRISVYGGTYYEAGEAARIHRNTYGVDVSAGARIIECFAQTYGRA
ncbi:GMP synthase (glutamine-hydrolyzing) [Arcanobacterium wilhelmae]|uniref:GMP synthase (Glutamine-hydrolyzing) n=1 Tax=Arcanobacterium wilhelmae TaxID=1803177 RepID=A0ABT9N8C4_9ACTO|nr:gamma-glutamyl-gamma-aminobutyrate hydrolase family protein [Arcanobacterium wilhelmae]MDP9799962.1 GMP synthase (glutamine-hydrolyzing) [Arcanobacterium wilhelmae]WFN91095.1 gamma-glutamyl-gamma-aminobutyrate hydrolase family protein [Arcanobacterium wilhelmae]